MTTANFAALASAVIAASRSTTWPGAVREWELAGIDRDPRGNSMCICGQTGLVDLYSIVNRRTRSVLFPIGSSCITLFGREELDRSANALSGLLRLRSADSVGDRIELTSEHFSRAVLDELYEAGAFTPNQWNGGDASRDYDFLLTMFNKRDKSAITSKQKAKIHALLHGTVLPFIRRDERLGF